MRVGQLLSFVDDWGVLFFEDEFDVAADDLAREVALDVEGDEDLAVAYQWGEGGFNFGTID